MGNEQTVIAYKVVSDPYDSAVGPFYSVVANDPFSITYRLGETVRQDNYPMFLFFRRQVAETFAGNFWKPTAILRCVVSDVLAVTPRQVLCKAGSENQGDVERYWGSYHIGNRSYPGGARFAEVVAMPPETILAKVVTPIEKMAHYSYGDMQ